MASRWNASGVTEKLNITEPFFNLFDGVFVFNFFSGIRNWSSQVHLVSYNRGPTLEAESGWVQIIISLTGRVCVKKSNPSRLSITSDDGIYGRIMCFLWQMRSLNLKCRKNNK